MKKILSILLAVVCLASACFCTTTSFASETSSKKTTSTSQYARIIKINVGIKVGDYLYGNHGPKLIIKPNSIIKVRKDSKGNKQYYGAKKGTYIAKFLDDGKGVGKVKIIVGNYKTTIKPKYKNFNLHFSCGIDEIKVFGLDEDQIKEHGGYNSFRDTISIRSIIDYPKRDATYSIKTNGKKILEKGRGVLSSINYGKSTYTLYQKVGKKTTKVGNFTVNIKKEYFGIGDLLTDYFNYDTNYFITEDYVDIGLKKWNATKAINKEISNVHHFYAVSPKYYTIKYSVANKKLATVNSKGIVQGIKQGETYLNIEIKFADGSVMKKKLSISTYEDDYA